MPAGFAGRINLTVPLATLLGLADRPGEIPGIGPIDPWLARDLARAAAGNPKTTWCVTVTDEHGHAIGHGCARPEPKGRAKRRKPGPPDGRDPPRGTSDTPGPGFSFTASGQHGPPGGYGTWRLRTGAGGPRDLIVALDPITTGDCDHRYQAEGHDPGVKLRHLSQIRHATCTGPVCRRPSSPVRLRTQHPVRGWWQNVSVQWRTEVPARPSAQAAPPLEGRPAPRRHLPVDHPIRPPVHHRTHALPDLTQRGEGWTGVGGAGTGVTLKCRLGTTVPGAVASGALDTAGEARG